METHQSSTTVWSVVQRGHEAERSAHARRRWNRTEGAGCTSNCDGAWGPKRSHEQWQRKEPVARATATRADALTHEQWQRKGRTRNGDWCEGECETLTRAAATEGAGCTRNGPSALTRATVTEGAGCTRNGDGDRSAQRGGDGAIAQRRNKEPRYIVTAEGGEQVRIDQAPPGEHVQRSEADGDEPNEAHKRAATGASCTNRRRPKCTHAQTPDLGI